MVSTTKAKTNPLTTPYQQFIHRSRYARWRDEDGRRETWDETVDRYIEFMVKQVEEAEEVE